MQSVAPQAEKVLDVASLLCSTSYALCVEGGFPETNVPTPGSLLEVASTIATPQHDRLRAQSEPRSVLDSGPTTKSVNSWGPKDRAEQCHQSAPIPAAQVDVILGPNILGEKRKLDQGQLSDVDAVDGDKGENHSVLCTDGVNIAAKITQS